MESNFNTTSEYNSSNDDKFQSVVRRKLERFRTKLSELLFTVNNASPNHIVNSTHTSSQFSSIVHSPNSQQQQQQQQMSTDDANSSMLISNYYYGYTSPISEEDLRLSYNKSKKKSKNFHQITSHTSSSSSSSSSSSACSSSSSMIIDDDDTNSNLSSYHSQPQTGDFISQYPVNFDSQYSLPHSLTTGVITLNKHQQQQQLPSTIDYYSFNSQLNSLHSNYDTSSLNTNEEENPFLNKRLTDQIHFNSDLNVLSSYFESALDLIDDMDNFFNIDFMTNYIAYALLKQINDSAQLKQVQWQLRMSPHSEDKNLLKEIAEQIFLESRDEPCGLKGCNISVYVREGEEQCENTTLVSRFQFGTSRFGAFDMNLFLSADSGMGLEGGDREAHQSTIATLTRRIFSNAKAYNNSSCSNNNKKLPSDNIRTVYLDSNIYDLFKTNLAYE